MAHATRQNACKEELWNVSLLPTVKVTKPVPPPLGPAPLGGTALKTAAVLAVLEAAPPATLAEAA